MECRMTNEIINCFLSKVIQAAGLFSQVTYFYICCDPQ